jgi:hypothetical protein
VVYLQIRIISSHSHNLFLLLADLVVARSGCGTCYQAGPEDQMTCEGARKLWIRGENVYSKAGQMSSDHGVSGIG